MSRPDCNAARIGGKAYTLTGEAVKAPVRWTQRWQPISNSSPSISWRAAVGWALGAAAHRHGGDGRRRAGPERRRLRQRRADHGARHRPAQQAHRGVVAEPQGAAPLRGTRRAHQREAADPRGQALGNRPDRRGRQPGVRQRGAANAPNRRAIRPDTDQGRRHADDVPGAPAGAAGLGAAGARALSVQPGDLRQGYPAGDAQ